MPNPIDKVAIDIYAGSTFRGTWNITNAPAVITNPRVEIKDRPRGALIFDSGADTGAELSIGAGPSLFWKLHGTVSDLWTQEFVFYELFVTDDADGREYAVAHGEVTVYPTLN